MSDEQIPNDFDGNEAVYEPEQSETDEERYQRLLKERFQERLNSTVAPPSPLEVEAEKELMATRVARQKLRALGVTSGMLTAVTVAQQATEMLRGRSIVGKPVVSAEQIQSLTTFLLAAGKTLDQTAEVQIGGLPPQLAHLENALKEAVRNRVASGAADGIVTVEADENGLLTVREGTDHDETRDETDDDGRVWHYLPASQLNAGTITANYQVVSEPVYDEERNRLVAMTVESATGDEGEMTWHPDQEVRMLCQGCTAREQFRRAREGG